MHLIKYKIILFIFSGLILGCTNENEKSVIPTVNIDPKIDFLDYNLSVISKKIKVIKLENNENSIINSMSRLIHVDQNNIIYRAGKKIIIFDAKGNYKNKIDAVGNGPKEYSTIISVFVEAEKKLIYIVDYKNITVYNYDSSFDHKIKKNIQTGGLFKSSDGNYVLATKQSYAEKNRDMLYILDSELNEIKSFKSKNTIDFKDFKQEFFFAGNPYEINKEIFYKEPLVDTIFKLKANELKAHWVIKSGEYKMDMRDVLSIEKSHKSRDKISTPGIKETKTHFFIKYNYKKGRYFSVFNKKENKFVFHKKYIEEDYIKNDGKLCFGIINDLTKDGPEFWPSYVSDDILVSVTHPVLLNEQQLSTLGVKEYDNPILFIAELK